MTQRVIGLGLAATRSLSVHTQVTVVRRLLGFAPFVPMLRRTVRERMRQAFGEAPPAGADLRYFRNLGWLYANTMAAFHHGLAATPFQSGVKFDSTIDVLDSAVAEQRGVVLIGPHYMGYDMVAAMVARRHPLVMVARQAPTAERAARKSQWYRGALDLETVERPSRDARAYLGVLRSGKVLLVTPDLLADAGQGVEVTLFGRPTRLHAGAFVLAIRAGAPIIWISSVWRDDMSTTITFERAPSPSGSNRDAAIRGCLQEWCASFEAKLRAHPENWLFWMDKRWSRFFHDFARMMPLK